MKLTYDIAPAARLIDLDEYKVSGGEMLYGFVAGLMASNYDITDLYIDGILKVLNHDINRLGVVLDEIAAIAGDSVKFFRFSACFGVDKGTLWRYTNKAAFYEVYYAI